VEEPDGEAVRWETRPASLEHEVELAQIGGSAAGEVTQAQEGAYKGGEQLAHVGEGQTVSTVKRIRSKRIVSLQKTMGKKNLRRGIEGKKVPYC
jgi:hypothetical protein